MSRVTLSLLLTAAGVVVAQAPTFICNPPLFSLQFDYPSGIPQQVEPQAQGRGPQSGYNVCNSTTQNQDSMCQTALVNHIDDFCLWAPPTGPTSIGDSEADEVAWCTQNKYGTRLIPEGTITGIQLLQAPTYNMIFAFVDQTKLNMFANDTGGELDPRGADLCGNPLGGLLFSNNLPLSGNKDNSTYTQVGDWTQFIGNGIACMKWCDPKDPDAANYCYNQLDRVGIDYVCPQNAQNGTFEVCESDPMQFPGVYVTNGVTTSYTQPPESLGPITTMPYSASIPASSNCVTYQSSDLFAALPTISGAATSGASSGSGSGAPAAATGKPSSGASASGSRTGSASAAPTGGSAQPGGAGALRASAFATVASVVFAVAFFA
ncbi:uncharacterized protein PHACADRAFT_253235 [Phanerochaete carnosa HHB-10118-sp]|uniref:Macrofage activating glycoprotein n=1 Tax=Phanerochaete carnosa (strain HHB-10118-sp) TaxID=650164 RepID=K5WHZ5_PHACS|nr:uncharacterized protein PHACADRAFT_253235 [Phanerochaete carnosa HHB-10118-sp]EKM58739.1 hypothetical protein PHACADRAFT_253235 [Phanerochaete carnosa HHB-10118-sp]